MAEVAAFVLVAALAAPYALPLERVTPAAAVPCGWPYWPSGP
jgi:hypothetical protein